MTTLFTIGFTGKSAEEFFYRLKSSGVRKVVDVRLYPSTQLSGFARKKDLAFFLKELCGIGYQHSPNLAPSEVNLRRYKDGKIDWTEYEKRYLGLLQERGIGKDLDISVLNGVCFLCAEPTPEKCHRRLLVEYLIQGKENIQIIHL